jgi:3-hydroxyisobutyrate dehydrogenase
MTSIAIVGTGRMGTAFTKRLIETGNKITVWNRSADKALPLAEAGAQVTQDLTQVVNCEVILLSLSDALAVRGVIEKLAEVGLSGRLVVDLSTLLPQETREVAELVTAAGGEFVDCPVGGTVGPALKGQLLGMAGGTESAFERAHSILEQLCKRVEHLGPVGSGSQMKLTVNLPLAIYWNTLAEALSLLKGSNIPVETAISMLMDSSGGPNVLKNRGQVVIDTLNGTDQPGTFDIAGLLKDLNLAVQQAKALGVKLPIAEVTGKNYRHALESGLSHFDGSSLTRHLLES